MACRCSDECASEAREYGRQRSRRFREQNPEHVRAYMRQYKKDHPEHHRKWNLVRYKREPEKWRRASRTYFANNREVVRANRREDQRRKRATTAGARVKHARWTEVELLVALDPERTAVEAALLLKRTYRAVVNVRRRYKLT